MPNDAFTRYNPITNFLFFIGAVVMGMFFIHPVYAVCSIVCSFLYYFSIKHSKGIKYILFLILLFIILSILNPVFNIRGVTVLFKVFGRPFTFEALLYGCTLAGMVISTLCWFACYNAVMSSDKFIYMFGRFIPTVSLILSMIFRLLPKLRKKADQIRAARACIGMAGSASESRKERIRNGAVVLNTLTGWALEDGIVTADSMRARGYGSGPRSSFAIYRMDSRNIACISALFLLAAAVVTCAAMGGTHAVFVPELDIVWFGNIWMLIGVILYILFMLVPAALNIKENVTWRILRSGI